MAGYIRGITIQIDGETKGLDAAFKRINTHTRKLQSELKRADSLLKLNPGNINLVRQKQELLKQSFSETKTKLDALRQAQKKLNAEGLDETNADYRRIQREIQETETKLKALTAEQTRFNIQSSKVGTAAAKMAAVGTKISVAGQKLKTVTMAAGLLGGAAVSVGKNFDESMSKVHAVSGATGKEFDQLRDKAREMGAKTKFTASEAAEAMNYMAMTGWKTKDMLAGVESIMNLAAASGEDLATTSDIVTDALTALGYSPKDSGHLADVMAAASSNVNTNVFHDGRNIQVCRSSSRIHELYHGGPGTCNRAYGKQRYQGNSGRYIAKVNHIQNGCSTSAISSTMDKLGVSITNADGTTRPFRDVLVDMRESMSEMSETEKHQRHLPLQARMQ